MLKAGLVTSLCSVFSLSALADTPLFSDPLKSSNTLQPFVSTSIAHEDNLFRLSGDELGRAVDGADTFRTVGGGLRFDRPVSRQLLTGMVDVNSVKFDRNRQLDYLRKEMSGDWHWFIARNFEGHIGGLYTQVLAPFADFHSMERNLRVNKKQYADGSWRLRSSYTKNQYEYDLPSQRGNDRTEDSLTSGVDYLAASGSTIGLQVRRLEGNYAPGLASAIPGFGLSGYDQDEAKVNILWLATGKTQVLFLGGFVRRQQKDDADRVNSGTNARLIVNWAPTGRIKLTGQTWREFSAIDGALIDSALTSGASAVTTWDISAKMQAVADLKRETRQFTPFAADSTQLVSAIASDSTKAASVGLVYKPLRSITVKASAFHEERAGSLAAGTNSYKVNGAAISASLQFQ